jgi:tetratricopeptide (TPR) repeat protein
MSQEYSFSLPYDAFDLDLIGQSPTDVGSSEFTAKVSEFFASEFAKFGGRARVICNDSTQTIDVKWTKERGFKDPSDRALELLQSGKIADAVPLLWTMHQEHPNDTDTLYNLGVAYSELGQIPKAIEILERLIELAPQHVHGLIGLGVAYIRNQKLQFGEDYLRKALKIEPQNQWALKNLGACLLKQGKADDAVPVLEAAVKAAPRDLQSLIGLGQALEEVGRSEDADDQYVKAIQIGGPQQLTDLAKERRTAIAHKTMRDRGKFRPDVMMYITGALDKFANMSSKEIQAIGFEIAILGQNGLDINNPDKKYSLRSLPGEFSGLHLCSIMFAAFKQFAPHEDVGIDFSKEYEAALEMRGR